MAFSGILKWLCASLLLCALCLPQSASARQSKPWQPVRHYFPGWLRVTQYLDCCITASGRHVYYGEAAGPPWIPFGAVVVIPGLGRFTVWDRGGAVWGNHIDIWVPYYPRPDVKDWYKGCWWYVPKAGD